MPYYLEYVFIISVAYSKVRLVTAFGRERADDFPSDRDLLKIWSALPAPQRKVENFNDFSLGAELFPSLYDRCLDQRLQSAINWTIFSRW